MVMRYNADIAAREFSEVNGCALSCSADWSIVGASRHLSPAMHQVDLTMVDISKDAWFDLDLNNYQNQMVDGYTHITPEAGLLIFMPDLDILPKTGQNRNVSMSG